MSDGFDARIMSYLELDYTKFAEFVLTGASDANVGITVSKMGASQMT
jgi:hypothetical protein